MSFQYACFISYRHSGKEKTIKFIEQFVDALENSLDQRLGQGIFIDRERLKAGYKFNIAITDALRQSICMVAILSPEYYNSDYCRQEYAAMERIESKRRAELGIPPPEKGLVLPLLVWGTEEEVPQAIRNNLHYVKMPFGLINLRSEINLAIWREFKQAGIAIPFPQREVRILGGAEIKYDPNLIPVIEEIGDLICEHHRRFADGNHCQSAVDCCAGIDLPDLTQIETWQLGVASQQALPSRVGSGSRP